MFLILPDQVDPGVTTLELNINTELVKELMGTLKVDYRTTADKGTSRFIYSS